MFFNMKIWCVFSLESPHRGDSNEYTQYTILIFFCVYIPVYDTLISKAVGL